MLDNAEHATEPTEPSAVGARVNGPSGLVWLLPVRRSIDFSAPVLRIGRSSACQIVLDGKRVSRVHAEVVKQGPLWTVRDLESTNGTFVDGRKITAAPLRRGAVVRIGAFVGQAVGIDDNKGILTELVSGFWAGTELSTALRTATDVAMTKLPIAISGETGTGKERVAKAIHVLSQRVGPYVAVNCASIPEGLAEATLFGHVRGAFTGAEQAATGLFRAADKGTLFLDEVAELPPSIQAKLLRAIQEKEVMPVGANKPVAIDVRIVCASLHTLQTYVRRGVFREDLMMRLNGLDVVVPPLRERRTEIPFLISLFARRELSAEPTLEPRLLEAMCVYDWPGNVRQLELTVQRLAALGVRDGTLRYRNLPSDIMARSSDEGSEPEGMALDDDSRREPGAVVAPASRAEELDERARLTEALKLTSGNVAAAAKVAQISRQKAYRLLTQTTQSGTLRQYRGRN